MKILIIGNPNSMWIYNYIKYILIPNPENQITVMYYDTIKPEYLKYYEDNRVLVAAKPMKILHGKTAAVYSAFKRREFLYTSGLVNRFDCIHVHFVSYGSLKMAHIARGKKTRLIVTPWGSDVLRPDKSEMEKRIPYLNEADVITIQSKKLYDCLHKVYGTAFDDKYVQNLKMGLDIFDPIDRVMQRYSIKECKKEFGFDNAKTVIGVGYNGSAGQQHIKVLEQLARLDKKYKGKIEVVLHISYSLPSEEYKEKLIQYAAGVGCHVILNTSFLFDEKMAMFRYATDIFVHAQVTDEYSASIQEYIYSGTTLINPTWIDYEEFKERGIAYVEYSDFDELPEIITNEIDAIENGKKRNFDYGISLQKLSSWNSYYDAWQNIYYG